MVHVRVNDNVVGGVSRYADPDSDYDRDDTWQEHYIESISQADENQFYDLTVEFDLDPKCEYYLLYAIYSTGDSFGHDEGRIEFVGLYENSYAANENMRRIEAHYETYRQLNDRWYHSSKQMSKTELKNLEKNFDSYSVTLIANDGREYKVSVPWTGYFESLTDVRVETVLVD